MGVDERPGEKAETRYVNSDCAERAIGCQSFFLDILIIATRVTWVTISDGIEAIILPVLTLTRLSFTHGR